MNGFIKNSHDPIGVLLFALAALAGVVAFAGMLLQMAGVVR
jgi:hypothetical protein